MSHKRVGLRFNTHVTHVEKFRQSSQLCFHRPFTPKHATSFQHHAWPIVDLTEVCWNRIWGGPWFHSGTACQGMMSWMVLHFYRRSPTCGSVSFQEEPLPSLPYMLLHLPSSFCGSWCEGLSNLDAPVRGFMVHHVQPFTPLCRLPSPSTWASQPSRWKFPLGWNANHHLLEEK